MFNTLGNTLGNSLRLLVLGSLFISPTLKQTPDPHRPLYTQRDHTLEMLKFPTHRLTSQELSVGFYPDEMWENTK